jgi:hypothetical protein
MTMTILGRQFDSYLLEGKPGDSHPAPQGVPFFRATLRPPGSERGDTIDLGTDAHWGSSIPQAVKVHENSYEVVRGADGRYTAPLTGIPWDMGFPAMVSLGNGEEPRLVFILALKASNARW